MASHATRSFAEVDLLEATTELLRVPSVSFDEAALADLIEDKLRRVDMLAVDRVGNNVVARTRLGMGARLLLAGHLDTVPPHPEQVVRVEGETLWGLGASDMKSGLAVMVALAQQVREPAVDLTWVFYVAEEVAAQHSGLLQLKSARPELLEADAAILGEPTGARLEAGCQGTLRVRVTFAGRRAHSARSWLGVNAIHHAAAAVERVARVPAREVTIDGCTYREGLQAVRIEGGVANNVIPDRAAVLFNFRFAPDRSPAQALTFVDGVLDDAAGLVEIVVEDSSPGCMPGLGHPLLGSLREHSGHSPRAKFGWTDVARFAEWGVPAANFGPGDPELAHTADERVVRSDLDAALACLWAVVHDERAAHAAALAKVATPEPTRRSDL